MGHADFRGGWRKGEECGCTYAPLNREVVRGARGRGRLFEVMGARPGETHFGGGGR